MRRCLRVPLALSLMLAGTASAAETHLLVISGIGGESYYSRLFQRWSADMAQVSTLR